MRDAVVIQFAAILVCLLGLAHSILGERYILIRLFRRNDLPKLLGSTAFTIQTLRFAWHITTVLWWGFAVLLWHATSANPSQAFVLQVIGYTSLASGLLPLIFTRGKHLSWLVLFIVGGIALSRSTAWNSEQMHPSPVQTPQGRVKMALPPTQHDALRQGLRL